jgi:hypothetical protein
VVDAVPTDDPFHGHPDWDELMGLAHISPPGPDPKRDGWVRTIEAIHQDLSSLAINRMAWRAMNAVWRDRPEPLPGSFLFTYFAYTYIHTQAAGIRRLVDRSKDTHSLYRLLDDIARYPDKINVEFLVGRFDRGSQWVGHRQFAELSADGDQLDRAIPLADRDELTIAASSVRNWVHKHVAHLTLDEAQPVPTFDELDTALDVAGRLLTKWLAVLTGADLVSIEPFPQYDWLAPLRVPWIVQ